MSNAEKMVSVPRELLERLISATVVARGEGSPSQRDAEAILAQPAEQRQGEPVAHARICGVGFDSKGKTVSMEIGVDNMPVPRKVELGEQLIILDDHRREVDRLRAELAGTIAESKRRRNCCADLIAERDTLRAQLAERAEQDALRRFANEIISASYEGGSFEGGDIQDMAVKHGLLRIESRSEE